VHRLSSKIKNKVLDNIAIPVAMVAILVLAGITAAASIAVTLRNSVLSAAGLLEIYFLFMMIKEL